MRNATHLLAAWPRCVLLLVLLVLAGSGRGWAQGCQLVPVPLAERVQEATLVVEAQVSRQQAEELRPGRIVTRSALTVFKVFKGQLPAGGLDLLTPGGRLGLRYEVVSGLGAPAVGTQGIFLLEPDPDYPGERRLAAGPQGLLAYDLPARTAADPFARYPAIAGSLYPTLAALTGQPARAVQPNAALLAAEARAAQPAARQLAATPVVGSLSPATVTAGTSTSNRSSSGGVLTINGSGFNAVQGTGYVAFRSADNPGTTTQPLASDYLAWSDTQIQVRVPTAGASGGAAGTGPVTVVNSDGNAAASGSSLAVTYALSNVASAFPTNTQQTYSVQLVGVGEAGNPTGYVLHYTASTAAGTAVPAAARTAFATALTTWRCQAGANRTLGDDASPTAASSDNVNLISFGTLSTGVLGVTRSYYTGCATSADASATTWELVETDYTFSSTANWYYGPDAPGSGQYDFQSVALHELGHGIQLSHIISSTGVMNYAIGAGQTRRTLDSSTDLAAASSETGYSTGASAHCNANRTYTTSSCPLPVELVAFAARYAPGQGTLLSWTTASEQDAASFAVESQEAGTGRWEEIARQPAAGSSATARHYRALDARPLAGLRYYRLRQADLDGTLAYSAVVAVQEAPEALAAYPNPAAGLVHLSGPLAPGATARVCLRDALGRTVRQASGPAGQAAFDLPLAGLPAGLYVLEWQGGAGASRLRLVVE